MTHAGKTATVICQNNQFQVIIDGETVTVVPRTTTWAIQLHRWQSSSAALPTAWTNRAATYNALPSWATVTAGRSLARDRPSGCWSVWRVASSPGVSGGG